MPPLQEILDFNLVGFNPTISAAAQAKIDAYIILTHKDWEYSFCKDFKDEFKPQTAKKQKRKCAYCRTTINVDGSGNSIDHVTPRIRKPHWMFVIHNLVVACDNCNSRKLTSNVLARNDTSYGNNPDNCPSDTVDYLIFNPYFDKWSEHFAIEDQCFLKVRPDTKGPATYNFCGMNRYHIIIDYLDQLKIREPISYRIIIKRIKKEKDLEKLATLKQALDYIKTMIDNAA